MPEAASKGSWIGNDPKADAKQGKAAKQADDGVLVAALLLPPAQDAGNGSDDQANGHDNIQSILDNFLSNDQHQSQNTQNLPSDQIGFVCFLHFLFLLSE